jgi:hypothetical protein
METEIRSPSYMRGLTLRIMLAILYSAVIVQPAIIWIYLVTGNYFLEAGIYATAFLFSELAALIGKPLTKNEMATFIIGGATAGVGVFFFPTYIYNTYFRRHPLLYEVTNYIPNWFSPPANSQVWELRTFIHNDWVYPISISLTQLTLLLIAELSLGFLATEIFVEQEKLPFPVQQATSQLCLILAERPRKRMKTFSICAIISLVYATFLYAIPSITYTALNFEVRLIPAPWIDLNYLVEKILPGASLGIATDPIVVALGILLPTEVVISILAGSASLYFAGNFVLTKMNLFTEWTPGMNMRDAWQRSVLHFWAGPIVAFGIAAGLLPIIFHPKFFLSAIKSLLKISSRRNEGRFSLTIILTIYLVSTVASSLLAFLLVSDFPFIIFIAISVGWTLIATLIGTRSLGVTGTSLRVPYMWQGVVLASGYKGYEAWFAPLVMGEASYWAGNFKLAKLTSTTLMDLVKAFFLAFICSLIFGLLYTQLFWMISAMPSTLFPVPFWDTNVNLTYLFISRKISSLFSWEWMTGTIIMAAAIYLLTEFIRFPISLIGFAAGMTLPIATPIGYVIGLLIKKFLASRLGEEWIEDQGPTIYAGVLTGESLMITLSVGISMIFKSRWIKPF